jgi:DNA-binding MarR family transcriptional regulator
MVEGAELGWQLSTAIVLFHEAVAQRLGLSAADHKALGLVMRNGPLTAGALAELTGLTPGAVTGLVDRLERTGHVTRAPDPADRRRVLISAALDRRTDLGATFAELSRAMNELVAKYDEREAAAIVDYLTNTIQVLRVQTRRLSRSDDTATAVERVRPGTRAGAKV